MVSHGRRALALPGYLLATVLVLFLTVSISRHFLRVRITQDQLVILRWGFKQIIDRADIGQVVWVTSAENANNYGEVHDRTVLIMDKSRNTMCKFEQRAWGPVVLKAIVQHLGGASRSSNAALSLAELRKIYPGSYSWARAHVFATTFIVCAVAVIGLFIADAVF